MLDTAMLCASGIATLVGLILGMRFKVASLVFSSCAVLALAIVYGLVNDHSLISTVLRAIAVLAVLQLAYLLGIALRLAISRFQNPED